ncbi:aldo/keto reductase [Actinoplanes sp. TBRC 11911]|uniref:aldo/keto reductase n=1 Tax=Actinoplanes sp. TBRC 11911 TaxID=2729386 RepID=UPI00145F70D4|nr:aldo/keto reductase [Actinoplanes sp. TBRC 11911]NMO56125.1 aldo/keto reductase [Actinoplanes sp. TBRC 11911]
MQMIELGRTGTRISQMALGAMQMGNATDEADSTYMLDRFLDAGGSFIDTADAYEWWAQRDSRGGHSEELLGRWMRNRGNRDRVFLATKGSALPEYSPHLWAADGTANWDLARRTFAGAGAKTLTDALTGSLRRLGTDHVDLYYIHVDDPRTPLEETLETLAGFVRDGKVRYLGWSNVRTWRLERIRQLCLRHGWPLPVAVQQEHSYLRARAGDTNVAVAGVEMLDYLRANGDQTLVAYSPILKGIYDAPAKNHHIMHTYAGPDTDARLAAVARVAAETGATPGQVVLAWLMQQSAPRVVPLIGPRTRQQFDLALSAVDVKLGAEQLTFLGDASHKPKEGKPGVS